MSGIAEAKLVRISFETSQTGRIYATSPDLEGLLIGRRTMDELEQALPSAIRDMYAAVGMSVVVSRLSDDAGRLPHEAAWVAFPAEIARQALAAVPLPA